MSEQKEFFRHMRGEQVDDSDAYLRTCAQLLREALHHPAHYQPRALTESDLDGFKARLKAARASSDSRRVRERMINWSNAKWALPLAASVILSVGVVRTGWELVSNDVAPKQVAVRSVDGLSIRVVDEPAAVAKLIQTRLSEFEIDSSVSEQHGVWYIEAFVPVSQEQQVNQILAPYQMAVGKNGVLAYGLKKP